MPGIILGDGYTEGNKIVKVFDSWTLHPWGKMETKKENKQINNTTSGSHKCYEEGTKAEQHEGWRVPCRQGW